MEQEKEFKKHRGIYQRGNIWWIKYYKDGKPYYESSGSDKVTKAQKLQKKREGEISEGKLPGIYFDKVLFSDLVEDFLNDFEINDRKTFQWAERNAKNLAEFFGAGVEEIPPEKREDSRRYVFTGGQRVTEITTSKIRKYIKSRQDPGLSNASINRELSSLKRMLKLAAEHEPPKVSRVIKIPMLKENNVRKGFFEHNEFLALRQVLPFYLRPVVTFAYYTGWRAGEIFGLTWDKVDLNEEVVRLNPGETKNEEPREIYLNEELMGMMKQLQARRSPGCFHVFQREGKPIRRITRAWKTACIRAGLSEPLRDGAGNAVTKKIRRKGKVVEKTIEVPTRIFHDFRRTAVRNNVRLGIPEETAMKISGHKTKAIFARYNISSKRDLKEAALKQNQNIQEKISNGYNLVTVDLEKAISGVAANA